jgi:hypothetical protein
MRNMRSLYSKYWGIREISWNWRDSINGLRWDDFPSSYNHCHSDWKINLNCKLPEMKATVLQQIFQVVYISLMTMAILQGHYFIWWLFFVTSCQLIYHINIAHSANYPYVQQSSGQKVTKFSCLINKDSILEYEFQKVKLFPVLVRLILYL